MIVWLKGCLLHPEIEAEVFCKFSSRKQQAGHPETVLVGRPREARGGGDDVVYMKVICYDFPSGTAFNLNPVLQNPQLIFS